MCGPGPEECGFCGLRAANDACGVGYGGSAAPPVHQLEHILTAALRSPTRFRYLELLPHRQRVRLRHLQSELAIRKIALGVCERGSVASDAILELMSFSDRRGS